MIRALIVEDDPVVGRALRRVLSRYVVVVDVVADASSAMRRLEVDAIDVVITDYDLGAASVRGTELADAIHERWPALPIVMASGSVSGEMRARALAAGVSEVFIKPVAIDALVATLRLLVRVP